jgi:recombinational DNA repair protein RecT
VDAREAVVDLLRVARAQLEAAQADAEVPYRERAQLITSCTGLCRLLARLSGQLEVTEVAIVRSAAWARAMRVVREVLEKHPAAAAELDAALERFASGGHE